MTADVRLSAIGQVARHVSDISASTSWYRDVLGLRHLYTFGQLAFFDCAGVRLFLQQGEGTGQNSVLYFQVPDIAVAVAALKAQGVQFIQDASMIHRHADGIEEWMAFFSDPDGQPLALMSQIGP